jgi:hypothetical protein
MSNVTLLHSPDSAMCYTGITFYAVWYTTLVAGNCTGPFWDTQQPLLWRRRPSHIRHGTDNIVTRYDTGRSKIHIEPFDVCSWGVVSIRKSPSTSPPLRACRQIPQSRQPYLRDVDARSLRREVCSITATFSGEGLAQKVGSEYTV